MQRLLKWFWSWLTGQGHRQEEVQPDVVGKEIDLADRRMLAVTCIRFLNEKESWVEQGDVQEIVRLISTIPSVKLPRVFLAITQLDSQVWPTGRQRMDHVRRVLTQY